MTDKRDRQWEQLGKQLKKKRLRSVKISKRGISLRAAAKEIGISGATLFRIEKGLSIPRPTQLARCKKWLGIKEGSK